MRWIEAFQILLGRWRQGEHCVHARVNLLQPLGHCPDCGQKVKTQWMMTLCKHCDAKRICHRTLLGRIEPVQQFCRHCGQSGFYTVRRDRIELFELVYALNTVVADIPETQPAPQPVTAEGNPFRPRVTVERSDVIDAEIIRRQEYRGTRSAFKSAPFNWQTHQNPSRYGKQPTTQPELDEHIIPFRHSS